MIEDLNQTIINLKVENEKLKIEFKHQETSKSELLEKLESLISIEKLIRNHLSEYDERILESKKKN